MLELLTKIGLLYHVYVYMYIKCNKNHLQGQNKNGQSRVGLTSLILIKPTLSRIFLVSKKSFSLRDLAFHSINKTNIN